MEKKYQTTEGTPYLYKDWKTGTITDIDGKKIDAALLKYDSYQDQLQIFKDGTTLILDAKLYPEFTLNFYEEGSTTQINRRFKTATSLELLGGKGFYEVFYEGKHKLVRKYKTDFIKDLVSDYGTNKEVEKFVTTDMFILVTPDGRMAEVKGGKNSVFELLGDKQDEAKAIAKKARYNIKNEYDFALLLEKLDDGAIN
ncbi:hypothetical protein [Fulvivirga sedimenti]|uniref:Uncharacterized protein n=1 Tax=Fulvivirga sedimenti TaxID=2879465 RepID=A0A9X1HVP1_9BACT|nr:hypothetical protein [Fulvivirga sedimenti]MCA6077903.1 hypothetical protein [Fulvivirga sedimenti]